jgi:hypothetical protein
MTTCLKFTTNLNGFDDKPLRRVLYNGLQISDAV